MPYDRLGTGVTGTLPFGRSLRVGDVVSVKQGPEFRQSLSREMQVVEVAEDGVQFVCEDLKVYSREDILRIVLRVTPAQMETELANPINTTERQQLHREEIREAYRKKEARGDYRRRSYQKGAK